MRERERGREGERERALPEIVIDLFVYSASNLVMPILWFLLVVNKI